jgi:signal transduction histidine kinase
LIANALKFTPKGGLVNVFLKNTNTENGIKRIKIEVKDTGIGIK